MQLLKKMLKLHERSDHTYLCRLIGDRFCLCVDHRCLFGSCLNSINILRERKGQKKRREQWSVLNRSTNIICAAVKLTVWPVWYWLFTVCLLFVMQPQTDQSDTNKCCTPSYISMHACSHVLDTLIQWRRGSWRMHTLPKTSTWCGKSPELLTKF